VVDLALLAAARFGAALSLLELELCELERAFSPLADEEVSDLLFDRKERLSAGIFLQLEAPAEQEAIAGSGNGARGIRGPMSEDKKKICYEMTKRTRVGAEEPRKIRKDGRWCLGE
jgi:hypothetical protein